MVPNTQSRLWGCVCCVQTPTLKAKHRVVLRWLYYCRRLSNGSRQEGPERKKRETNPGAEQDPGPRLGPTGYLKSVVPDRDMKGSQSGVQSGAVQPPTGSLGCSEGKLTTTTKMTATCAGSRSVTHTPGEALCNILSQKPITGGRLGKSQGCILTFTGPQHFHLCEPFPIKRGKKKIISSSTYDCTAIKRNIIQPRLHLFFF